MKKTLLAALCAVTLPLSAFAVDIHSARGQVNVPDAPQKVVAYDIGVLDTLDALGVQPVGVPDKLYVDYLKRGDAKVVGSLFEPDLEELFAVEPDWIAIAGRSAKQYDVVSKVAPTADLTLKSDNVYAQSLTRLDDLGKVFGKQEEAKALTERLNKLRDEVKEKAEGTGKVMVLLVTGPKLSVYGENSRTGWLKQELGLDLVEEDMKSGAHGEPVSFEYIAESNPDWLIVIDRAAAIGKKDVDNAKTVLDNELVAQTNAWKNDHVIYLNPADVYIAVGGVQATEHVLNQLNDAFAKK